MHPEDIDAYLAKHKGKVVVINFWASWCAPCRVEFPELEKLRRTTSAKDLAMLGVSLDFDSDMFHHFSDRQEFGYPVRLAAPTFMDAMGIRTIPKTWVYDTNGKLVQNHDGPVGYPELMAVVKSLLTTQKQRGRADAR